MSFQYENVILPDEPVLLVSRDWKIPGRKPRKSNKGQSNSFRGVQSFRVKGQPESSGKIQLEAGRENRPASGLTGRFATTAEEDSEARERRKRREAQAQNENDAGLTDQAQLSDSSSSDGSVFDARLLDRHDYTLVPSSHSPPIRFSDPGVDTILIKLTSYHVPEFIPKGNYLTYYVENVGNFFYPLKGMYTLNPLRSVWLPIILVDELWFYTILYTVARHLDASPQHRGHEREVAFLADALIKRLRSRLSRSGDGEFLTDIDCAAVACLLGVEHAFGTKDSLAQHARGLAEFVKKRGGIKKVSGVLRSKICRADIEAVVDDFGEPAIVFPEEIEPLSVRLRLPGSTPQITMHPAYNSILSHLSPILVPIAVDFLSLVAFLEQETKNLRLLDPFILDDSILNLQHRIVRSDDADLNHLDHAFRSACLIFLKCLSRPLDVVTVTSTPLAIRLGRHLEKVVNPPRPLLHWLLYMGLIAGDALCLDRIGMASRLVDDLKTEEGALQPWQFMKEQLKQIAWVDIILDGLGEKVWSEMETVALV